MLLKYDFLFIKSEFPFHNCKGDVGFLIDGSSSIVDRNLGGQHYNWNIIKDFILVLGHGLNISEDESHLAVVVFSLYAKLEIKFSDATNYEDFEKLVTKLPHPQEATYPLRGFDTALNQMFDVSNGMRLNVRQTLIYITDGDCMSAGCAGKMVSWGERFDDRGIKRIGIGIGSEISKQEIVDFVGLENYVHKLRFNQLLTKDFRRNLSLCEAGE